MTIEDHWAAQPLTLPTAKAAVLFTLPTQKLSLKCSAADFEGGHHHSISPFTTVRAHVGSKLTVNLVRHVRPLMHPQRLM